MPVPPVAHPSETLLGLLVLPAHVTSTTTTGASTPLFLQQHTHTGTRGLDRRSEKAASNDFRHALALPHFASVVPFYPVHWCCCARHRCTHAVASGATRYSRTASKAAAAAAVDGREEGIRRRFPGKSNLSRLGLQQQQQQQRLLGSKATEASLGGALGRTREGQRRALHSNGSGLRGEPVANAAVGNKRGPRFGDPFLRCRCVPRMGLRLRDERLPHRLVERREDAR